MSSPTWLETLNTATEYLSPAYRFREKLNAAIQLFQSHFESSYAILMELSPSITSPNNLHFQRLLKIPLMGIGKEYPIPRPLIKAQLSSDDILEWLKELSTETSDIQPPPQIACYPLTFTQLNQLQSNRIARLLSDSLDLEFVQMYVFPLLLKKQLWGLLCFCSPTIKAISHDGYYCSHIFSRTLADALAQQQYDIRETLRTEYFAAKSSIGNDVDQKTLPSSQPIPPEEHLLTTIITNTVPGAIFLVDIQEGKAIFANTQYFLGYEIEQNDDPLELFASIIHPDDLNVAVLDFIYQLKHAADGEIIKSEYRMQHQRGHWVWISERAKVFKRFPDGVVHQYISIMQDITKERGAEELLLKQTSLLQATLNTLPDIKLRLNSMGQLISVFGAEETPTNLQEKIRAKTVKELADFLPLFVVKGMQANIQKAQQKQNLQTFEFFLSNRGEVNYYEARIAPLEEDEVILVLRNMTPLKAIQNDLREQNTKLDQKNRLLQKYIESNLQLENFAYIASHDLREPLRTIRTFAQYLNRDIGSELDQKNRSHLDFVIGAANRMNQLIEDLLKYSTVNSDTMTNEPIELPDLLDAVLQELQSTITAQEADIQLVDIPARIYGSPARIKQLFQNLISNAVKFRKPEVPPQITIRGEENPNYWQFSVQDNGIGIDPEFYNHIFIIFKRLHAMDKYQGTGIGLALVKRIVNQHGGDIWVESQAGEGTTFTFTILK
jgi:PAS domain S-box-containing protein